VSRVPLRGCLGPHAMVAAIAEGWFVCAFCGVVAVCPGCVEVSEGMRVHLCFEHGYLAGSDGLASRTVWATKESAR
jgi:hypothetical protein